MPVSDVSTLFVANDTITLAAYNGPVFLGSVNGAANTSVLSFSSARGITSLRLSAQSWWDSLANFCIDNLTFTAVPEPGIVGLLVVGAAAFLVSRYQ